MRLKTNSDMKRILLFSLLINLMFLFDAKAQRIVSGKVTDDAGSEVPGVNVIEKGTTKWYYHRS